MKKVHLDYETYSEADLTKVGAIRYAHDPSTDIIVVGLAEGDEDPTYYAPEDPELLRRLEELALEDEIVWCAHNWQFEHYITWLVGYRRYGYPRIPMDQWNCTSARARAMGLPGSLDNAAAAIGLDVNKDKRGKQLIQRFSKPDRSGNRVFPNQEEWEEFGEYCAQDVVVERALDEKLPELDDYEHAIFRIDGLINSRGIPVNMELVDELDNLVGRIQEAYHAEFADLTGGLSPTQNKAVMEKLNEYGLGFTNMQAATVEDAIARLDPEHPAYRLLEIRYDASRVGIKKLPAMQRTVSPDGTVKGVFMYYGAFATGRFTSGLVQLQNFAKCKYDEQERVISAAKEVISAAFGQPPAKVLKLAIELIGKRPLDALSKAIRGVLQAPKGKKFVAADFSSIEARVLAWLAGEEWLLEAFRKGEDAYIKMAALIYGIPESSIDPETEEGERQRFFGKQVVLGAGYSMAGPRFVDRCADFGVFIENSVGNRIIKKYRNSVPAIAHHKTGIWARYQKAALLALKYFHTGVVQRRDSDGTCHYKGAKVGPVRFSIEVYDWGPALVITLPSGRKLHYWDPKKNGTNISYNKYYGAHVYRNSLYGGLITQNICQAVARDLLCESILTVERHGYQIVIHVHDDACSLVDVGAGNIDEYEALMCMRSEWAWDIPIEAKGWEGIQWRK